MTLVRERPFTSAVELPLPSVGPLRRMDSELCACGGVVHADRFEPAQGVAAHNRSVIHKRWRVWMDESESWTENGDKALPERGNASDNRGASQANTGGAVVDSTPVKPCSVMPCMTLVPVSRDRCRFHGA